MLNIPQAYYLAYKYQLDSLNKFKDLNILSKNNNTTNVKDIDLLNQENQDYYNQHHQQFIARKHDGDPEYYNWHDQQFIACKYNSGLKQVTIELVPNIIMEEEKDSFYQWADKYDQWDNNPYTPKMRNEMGGSNTFNTVKSVFNLAKTKHNGKAKTWIVSEVSTSNNKSDFYIGERQKQIWDVWS